MNDMLDSGRHRDQARKNSREQKLANKFIGPTSLNGGTLDLDKIRDGIRRECYRPLEGRVGDLKCQQSTLQVEREVARLVRALDQLE